MFSQNAISNLKNRYSAVLTKCTLLNTFGSLAVAGMLCVSAACVVAPCGLVVQDAWAGDIINEPSYSLTQNESGKIDISRFSGYLAISSKGGNYTYTSTADGYISGSLSVSTNITPEHTTTLKLQTGTLTVNGNATVQQKGKLIVESGASLAYARTLTVENGGLFVTNGSDFSGDDWVNTAISSANENLAEDAKLDTNSLATLAISNPFTTPSNKRLYFGNYDPPYSGSTAIGFGSDSLLVVNAGALGNSYALTTTEAGNYESNIEAYSGAKLLVSNVAFTDGKATVKIANAFGSLHIEKGAWGYDGTAPEFDPDDDKVILSPATNDITETATEHNLYFANALIEAASYTYDLKNHTYTLHLTKEAANNELPLLDKNLAAHIDKAIDLPDYINKAIELKDKNEAASIIESAAKLSVGAGVLTSLSTVSELGASAVGNRSNLVAPTSNNKTSITQLSVMLADNNTSFTDTPVPLIADAATGNGLVDGFALWVQPLYQNVSADGFKSGNFDYGYDTDIFGVSLGADYTMDSSLRFGLAFHMGGGDTESNNSDLSYTKNDFDYYGATLYSAYVFNNLSLSADIGYTVTTNDVVQQSSIGQLSTGDFDAGAFSIGARAQYKVATSFVDIVPYLGARLNYSHVDSFNTKDINGVLFHNESADATTFGIPVGVTFAKTMDFEDFTLTPRAKVGVQLTMGDLDVEQRVSLPNVSGHASMESEVFDPVTFMGGVGLDFAFDNVNLALEYNLGASENVVSQQVMATFSYKF